MPALSPFRNSTRAWKSKSSSKEPTSTSLLPISSKRSWRYAPSPCSLPHPLRQRAAPANSNSRGLNQGKPNFLSWFSARPCQPPTPNREGHHTARTQKIASPPLQTQPNELFRGTASAIICVCIRRKKWSSRCRKKSTA